MNLLTFDATIFDEIAGRAVLQFGVLAAALATIFTDICSRRRRAHDNMSYYVNLGSDLDSDHIVYHDPRPRFARLAASHFGHTFLIVAEGHLYP